MSKEKKPVMITSTMVAAAEAVFVAREAEENLREAERLLIEVMEPLTGITFDCLLRSPDGKGEKHLSNYIDLNLRLLLPFVSNANNILKGGNHGKC